MSFYGLVVVFVLLVATVYLSAFFFEMSCESAINLAFERCGLALREMTYLNSANLTGASQAYLNYTLAPDGATFT
jgi:hypothetical protein